MLHRVNGEILNLGDTLLRLKSTGVFHTKPLPELTRDGSESKLLSSISEGQWVVGEFVDGSGQTLLHVGQPRLHEGTESGYNVQRQAQGAMRDR